MIKKKIIGYIATAAILTMTASAGISVSATANKTTTPNSNNHILLAAPEVNTGNQAAVINGKSSPLVLYKEASSSSSVNSYLTVGEMLTINSSNNGFYNVTVHETGATGFISESNLQKITSGINDSFNTMNNSGQVINVSSSVHLRANATMNSSVVTNLSNSTKINILGKQGNWYKVSTGNQTGFIYQLYVGVNSSQTQAPTTKPSTNTNSGASGNTTTVAKPNTSANNTTKPSTGTNNSATTTKPSTSTNNSTTTAKPSTGTNNSTTTTKPSTNTNNNTNNSNSATTNSGANTSKPSGNNSAVVPGNNIIYSAQSYAVPANQVAQMVNGTYKGGGKEVFLTFDDGPSSTYTPQVLKILNQNGVHGTFFVLGSELQSKTNQNILKQELMDGNAIGNHSYSHNYSTLYPGNSINVNAFMNEFNKTESMMQSVLGSNFNSKVLRMPGGENSRQYYHDKNLPAFKSTLSKDGITSIDWNAENGDATGKAYTSQQLVQNAINQSKGKNHVVLLMHDVKGTTVQALPQIIQYYKSQGYSFKVISNSN
ncbi:MAG: polysaccharide deacetylase family protein [Sarcina sp.]